jgi:hypothetical protein
MLEDEGTKEESYDLLIKRIFSNKKLQIIWEAIKFEIS